MCFSDFKRIFKCPWMWILGIPNFIFSKSSFTHKQNFMNEEVPVRLTNGKSFHRLYIQRNDFTDCIATYQNYAIYVTLSIDLNYTIKYSSCVIEWTSFDNIKKNFQFNKFLLNGTFCPNSKKIICFHQSPMHITENFPTTHFSSWKHWTTFP